MEKISNQQLFFVIMMVQIGSTNLWAIGIKAKQDAWIVILLSTLAGLGLIWIFTELQSKFPDDNIAGITISLLGKVIGWPLAFVYSLFYIFVCTRNVSEFGDLINMTFLQETPRVVINFIFLGAIIYILFLGLETLARMTQIILPLTLFLIISVYIMVIASGRVDMKLLTPILGNGIMPVLKASYPVGINLPFGFAFVYMQIWHYTDTKKDIKKTSILAVALSGLLLSMTLVIIITTLGTNFASGATIPFLEVIKLINIGDIITNLDAIGVILILLGGFYRATLNFFSATLILTYLFKIKNYRRMMIPLGALILWYTNVYEPNFPTHSKYLIPHFWQHFVPLCNVIPILLLLIFRLKSYSKKLKSKHS